MAEEFFGLDIGTAQIKAVQVKRRGDTKILTAAGLVPSPSKGLLSDATTDQERMATELSKFVSSLKITTINCVSALPESQIFTRVIQMPILNDKELASAIRWEAEQYIPVPLTEVNLAWQILARPPNVTPESKMDVLLIASPKVLVEKHVRVLKLAGLKPVGIETEILAMTRSLTDKPSPTTLLISIGAYTTDIFVAKQAILLSTRSIATGGEAFTKTIIEELGFEKDQAEEYKKNYGLLEDQLEGKIAAILKPVFEILVGEIKKVLGGFESKSKEKVRSAILTGGGAKMPGIIEFLAQELNLEVTTGDPWTKLEISPDIPKPVLSDRLYFAVATGLALKNL